MRRLRPWLLPLLALLFAGGLAVLRSQEVGHSRLPLMDNQGPHGSAVLATYLREGGLPVHALTGDLPTSEASEASGTWILAAPTARIVSKDEVARLRAFVERGGTLVYLSAKPDTQPHLSGWLGLSEGPQLERGTLSLRGEDPGGVTLDLLARGGGGLRVAAGPGLVAEGAQPIAAKGDAVGLWRRAQGRGVIWIAAGSSLIENARLQLADNLSFWATLGAHGPITWIETFHVPVAPPSSGGLRAFALQLLLCIALAAWCFGPRLGPPRPLPEVRHRSSLESVRALGWLLRRSRVEPELAAALHARLRAAAESRLGIPSGLAAPELAAVLQQRAGLPVADTLALLEELGSASQARTLSPRAYARLSTRAALAERALHGAQGPRLEGDRARAGGSDPVRAPVSAVSSSATS